MSSPDDFDYATAPAADRLILRREVIRQGSTDADIRRALGENTIERVWWGSYVPTRTDDDADVFAARAQRYREMVLSARRTGGPERYLSHQSAACILDVPLLQPDTSTVHFTTERTGRTSPGLVIHQSPGITAELVESSGIVVTGIGRTVCDVARQGTFRQAVCALESGLYQAQLRRIAIDLPPIVAQMSRMHGIGVLREALTLAQDCSESIGESLSKVVIVEAGTIPLPEQQVEIVIADGSTKRCDFGWRDADGRLRVVGEFDGRFKYHRSSAASGHRLPEDVIYAEKLREDAIRDYGIVVIRWTWGDLQNPAKFARKLLDALRRGGII